MPAKTYSSDTIEIHFDGSRCIHARNCVLTLPQVYQAGVEGDWIKPENASAEDIAAMARTCPSGAITYTRKDGGEEETNPMVNTVRLKENGPLEVRGELTLNGETISTRAMLCRCGQSKNKPFCDGAHVRARFEATGELPMKPSDDLPARNGPLEIDPRKDGPLRVAGNMEIICGSGSAIEKKGQAFFCRCGLSQNKPYCDGSHRDAGFEADGN